MPQLGVRSVVMQVRDVRDRGRMWEDRLRSTTDLGGRMRKIATLIVGVFVASLAMVAVAQADDIQSITANLTPSKRSKKTFKPAQIYVEILTGRQHDRSDIPGAAAERDQHGGRLPEEREVRSHRSAEVQGEQHRSRRHEHRHRDRHVRKQVDRQRRLGRARQPRPLDRYVGLGHDRQPRQQQQHAGGPGRRHRVQRQGEGLPVPALAGEPARRHHGARRQAQDGQQGPRRATAAVST